MVREALKISSPSGPCIKEVARFHGESLWHSIGGVSVQGVSTLSAQ